MDAYDIIESEGLIEVASIGEYDYSWAELKVFYSPKARRFFWLQDSGCSCSHFGEYTESFADFSDGDKQAALRAFDEYAEELKGIQYASSAEDCATEKAKIRNFETPA